MPALNINRFLRISPCAVILLLLLSACQLAAPPSTPTPSATPLPTQTPTITPTPAPREMGIDELQADCAALDERDTTVILKGRVFLPDETIYGYEGWYGVDLITGSRMTVLFAIGDGANQMRQLPQFFHEQSLLVHDAAEREIRQGHEVRVTGRPKYRADSETRRCEVWVDEVESLMPADTLEPADVTVEELNDDDNIYECGDLEFSRRFVRLTGELRVDNFLSNCRLGICSAVFKDASGSMTIYLEEGEGANQMRSLPSAFTGQDLVVQDAAGAVVDNAAASVVGVVRQADIGVCEMIVYEVDRGTAD